MRTTRRTNGEVHGKPPFVFRRHWDHEPPPHPPFGHPLPLGGGEGGVRGVRGEGEWRVEQLGEHRELFPLPEGEGQGEGERDRAHWTEMDHSPNSRTPRVLRPSRTFPKMTMMRNNFVAALIVSGALALLPGCGRKTANDATTPP